LLIITLHVVFADSFVDEPRLVDEREQSAAGGHL
jgi:hypothetical protein